MVVIKVCGDLLIGETVVLALSLRPSFKPSDQQTDLGKDNYADLILACCLYLTFILENVHETSWKPVLETLPLQGESSIPGSGTKTYYAADRKTNFF